MGAVRRGFVDASYGQMHYRIATPAKDTGKRPLLCLHQSPKSSKEFAAFIPAAAADRTVVAIDSPGHGESDVPGTPIGIEGYAREIWSAVDALDLGTVDLLGHHTGAKVAVEMAYQRGRSVGSIVMVSALVLSQDEQDEFKAMFQPIPLDEDGTRFKHMWAQALKYRGPGVSLEMLAASMAENLRAGEAYEWGHQAAFEYNAHFPDRVATLDHRITVMNPADMLFEYTPRVGPLLKKGEVVDYPNWGAGFLDTDPKGAAKAVKAAIDG